MSAGWPMRIRQGFGRRRRHPLGRISLEAGPGDRNEESRCRFVEARSTGIRLRGGLSTTWCASSPIGRSTPFPANSTSSRSTNFNTQFDSRKARVNLAEHSIHFGPLASFLPTNEPPTFEHDRERVTREAAGKLALCSGSSLRARSIAARRSASPFKREADGRRDGGRAKLITVGCIQPRNASRHDGRRLVHHRRTDHELTFSEIRETIRSRKDSRIFPSTITLVDARAARDASKIISLFWK